MIVPFILACPVNIANRFDLEEEVAFGFTIEASTSEEGDAEHDKIAFKLSFASFCVKRLNCHVN